MGEVYKVKGEMILNLPNMLTLSRFVLIPVYIIVFAYGHIFGAFLILVLAGLTDILDGYIARKKGQITQLGIMLDPLADKTMMMVVVLSLVFENLIPWEAAAAMFIREVGMIISSAVFHFRGKLTVPANLMGKLTTVLYYFAILFIVLEMNFALTFLWTVIIFSFITSTIYIFQFTRLNHKPSH
jgi:cardiolipin synthase